MIGHFGEKKLWDLTNRSDLITGFLLQKLEGRGTMIKCANDEPIPEM